MPEFYEARRLRYEIHVLVGGRWQIAATIDDGRDALARRFDRLDLEATERRVIEQANAALAGVPGVKAVKVLRERTRDDGFATVAEIFMKQAPSEAAEAPLGVAPLDGPVGICETADQACAREGYKAIGTLLRGFLDRLQITPPELLHHAPYQRKLQDNSGLVQGAVHQLAQAQLKAAGGDLKVRSAVLHSFVETIEKRARGAAGERKLPVLENADLERLRARIEARMGPKDALFWCNVAVARALQASPGHFGKLEAALHWVERPLEPAMRGLADNYVACALDNPAIVHELLGHCENLAVALGALADLAQGKLPSEPAPESRLGILAAELAAGRLPLAAQSLWDRVLREAARGRPLARNDARREWTTITKLSGRLAAECPAAMQEPLRQAFRARMRRLQQAEVA